MNQDLESQKKKIREEKEGGIGDESGGRWSRDGLGKETKISERGGADGAGVSCKAYGETGRGNADRGAAWPWRWL